jgi:alcohol dehydrogenase (cytochrome c)
LARHDAARLFGNKLAHRECLLCKFLALDAKTGEVLYRFNTGGSIGGGVISYALDGKQYVATTSGTVSAFFGGSGLPAVVIFALP